MPLIICVLQACDDGLGCPHYFGELLLREFCFRPNVVNELSNLGVHDRVIGQLTQLAVAVHPPIQNLHSIGRLLGFLCSLCHN